MKQHLPVPVVWLDLVWPKQAALPCRPCLNYPAAPNVRSGSPAAAISSRDVHSLACRQGDVPRERLRHALFAIKQTRITA